ncbi:hypothetical protein F503_02342 [Ophiostoma piceae UAMH 11346]|uniref:Uncharacterized protein n=1 Tax=Ophiostoma piceae (strain UAMH 11346) TaxID=1262450 RepID=S3CH16_OPHP1|nr:hypothetical protein F503_02342 [Ophiostoma piceae UAMH 11346]
MSIITTSMLQSLWTDVQQVPLEWATTRFWEYIFNRIVFHRDPWVVSSQQPPLHDPGVARRVDLVVERIDPATGSRGTVLFVEMKRTSATQTELTECELQAYTAGCEYFTGTGMARVWAMTCIGSEARLWIFDVSQGFLVPYFPTSHGKAVRAEYVEVSGPGGTQLLRCLDYIKLHPVPPEEIVTEVLASSSDESTDGMEDSNHDPESPDIPSAASAPTIPLSSAAYQGDTAMVDDSGSYKNTPYPYYDPTAQDRYGPADEESAHADTADIGPVTESESQPWLKISLYKVSHFTSRDEFIFTAFDGKEKSTDRDEWKKVSYNGRNAWYLRYKGRHYYTRDRPVS